MNSSRRSFFYFVFTGLYAIILLTFLLLPADSLPSHKILSVDKLWHMLSYFLLALGLMFAFREGGWRHWYNRRWSLIISLGHAGFSEVFQEFVPGRSASFGDWIANCIGIGLALLGLKLFPEFFEKSSSS
ncbi:MAG: VanZ family protein [Fidelibacterota bacterium]